MSESFTRTPQGLVEKWRFFPVPTVWVEGFTDIYFYEPITSGLDCRTEAFHGIMNSEALIEALVANNYPYIVILDGDYSILRPCAERHRNVVRLKRYSCENFLWEVLPANRLCLRHSHCGDDKDLLVTKMADMVVSLKSVLGHAIVLDVAARRSPIPPKVLPDHIGSLLKEQKSTEIDQEKVDAIALQAEGLIDPEVVSAARLDVELFLRGRCVSHLLKGHLVFGLLKLAFVQAAASELNQNVQISTDVFMQMLAEMVWRQDLPEDHRQLKDDIVHLVNSMVGMNPVS